LDEFNLVSPQTALNWLLGGLGVFAVVGAVAAWTRPEDRVPWAPKQLVKGAIPEEWEKYMK